MSEVAVSLQRVDPRRPLVLDIRELHRGAGSMRTLRRTVPAPADLRVEMVGVADGAPIDLDLRLESVVEGVFVSGSVSAELTGECGRCLGPLQRPLTVDVGELFAYPDSATEQTTDETEIRRIDGDRLDLEPALRDAVVLALPLTPLCRDECAGLCSGCGQRWDELPADHRHEILDPRWAALAERVAGTALQPGTGPTVADTCTEGEIGPGTGTGTGAETGTG